VKRFQDRVAPVLNFYSLLRKSCKSASEKNVQPLLLDRLNYFYVFLRFDIDVINNFLIESSDDVGYHNIADFTTYIYRSVKYQFKNLNFKAPALFKTTLKPNTTI